MDFKLEEIMVAKKIYFVGSGFPKSGRRNDLAINTSTNTINYHGPNGWVSVSGSGGTADTGDITFDGVQIVGAGTASGDGYNNGTIELVPDATHGTDQYLIIDPTAPNHIHIRGGGTQDESQALLILGGERNNVEVSDGGRTVVINTRPETVVNSYVNANSTSNANFVISNSANIYVGDEFSYPAGAPGTVTVTSVTSNLPSSGLQTITATGVTFVAGGTYVFSHEESWNNSWIFGDDGVLSGPAMGSLGVNGIYNNQTDDLFIGSSEAVQITGTNGEFLNDANVPTNQIATLGDIAYTRVNVPTSSLGQAGDVAHRVADDTLHHYFCTGTYDGTTHIWKRIAWTAGTWGV